MRDTGTQPLWKIVEDPNLPAKDKLSYILLRATRVLDQQVGLISQVEKNTYRVIFVTENTPIHAGQEFVLGDTYCGIAMRQGQVMSVDTMRVPRRYRHPCHELVQVEAYIGVPVYANSGLFGTLNFISARQHTTPFTDSDRAFVDRVGAMVGEVLDQWTAQAS